MSLLAHVAAAQPDHTGHVLLSTGLALVVLLAVALVEKLATDRPSPAQLAVGATCAVAAGIHLAVTPEHWQVDPLYGMFFLLTAIAQLAAAGVVLRRPSHRALMATSVVNAGLVVLWLETRLIAVPLGVEGGEREGFGVLDVAAAVVELVAVAAAVRLLSGELPVEQGRATSSRRRAA